MPVARVPPYLHSFQHPPNGASVPPGEPVREDLPKIINPVYAVTPSSIGTTPVPSGTLGPSYYRPEIIPHPFQFEKPHPNGLALFTSGGIH